MSDFKGAEYRLQDNAQKEGTRVLDFMERYSQTVLERHGFDGRGQPGEAVAAKATVGPDRRLTAERVQAQLEVTVQEMARRGFSPAEIRAVRERAGKGVYEDPSHCTNVAVDDVDVKKQKAHRARMKAPVMEEAAGSARASPAPEAIVPNRVPAEGASKAGQRARPKVANTVARIEHGIQCFTLSGSHLGQVLRFVLAFLLDNGLLGGRLHLFTDGYRSLQETLLAFFVWHPRVWLVLDWHHLIKKFQEDLSRACRSRELRNGHLRTVARFLWYGMVTEALRYLEAIPRADLKNPASIERLQSYLQCNEPAIPCYALRRRLGLRNGSSPVESANNEVTARRQKRNGMSWSKAGSRALTALSVLVCNRSQGTRVRKHIVPLRFVDKEAA